jgi:lipoprotein-anchoring transpeptidase ErfK/SrfK
VYPRPAHGVGTISSLRHHRYWIIAAVALAAVLVLAAVDLITAPHVDAVTPAAGSASSDASPTVVIDLPGAGRLDKLAVRLDGKDVTRQVRVADERLFFEPGKLDDGEHVVSLSADTPSILRPRVNTTWTFTVDTVDPTVTIYRPRSQSAATTLPVTLRGTTEPGASVTIKADFDEREWTGAVAIAEEAGVVDHLTASPTPSAMPATPSPAVSTTAMAGGEGGIVVSPTAEEEGGASPTTGASSTPATSSPSSGGASPDLASPSPSPTPSAIASPTTEVELTATADGRFAAPLTLPDGPVTVSVTATDAAGNTFTRSSRFVVDVNPPELIVGGLGKVVRKSKPRIAIVAADRAGASKIRVRLDGEVVCEKTLDGTYTLPRDVLAEGRHTLLVTATDQGGSVTTDDRGFLVNSTEKLGKATLIAGAKGHDVRDLQKLLTKQGYLTGPKTGVYDKRTIKAVQRMQESLGMSPDGIVGPQVLAALRGRIVIDQSEHRLYFYFNGRLRKTYSVATGQPAYPTPNGTFYVQWMTKNPTWTPPDSPWAAGAEPIPPGPNNPVGMRWIGTSYPGVGIHGVPPSEDGSIGTYASHGCIRMHEWDVEELYEWVTEGMPVIIRP